ncbi:MAG: PepSY domain-containing protein [Bacteroidetes bacterium]|nr:PepSY domain-containing protein [Bacteroidota bacterium]MDA1121496.1 PepSY domain-containing protein [Bacteroidota bacterium]
MTFAEAKEVIATETDGELIKWELRQKEIGDELIWVYNFKIKDGDESYEVKINAVTGEFYEFERERDDDGIDHLSDELRNRIAAMVSGDIIEARVKDDDNKLFWKILVETTTGSKVEIVINKETGALILIEGEHGSFDYEVVPNDELISFSEARTIALATFEGQIVRWSLERHEDAFTYWFKIEREDGHREVGIDAVSGDVIAGADPVIPEGILEQIAALIDGEISIAEHDESIWEIVVVTESQGRVLLKFLVETGELKAAYGFEGPFEYNVTPGGDLLALAAIREIVLDTGDEVLIYWELKRNDNGTWIYKLKIKVDNQEFDVLVNAVTGEIL